MFSLCSHKICNCMPWKLRKIKSKRGGRTVALSRWGVLLSLNQKGNERCFNAWHSAKCFCHQSSSRYRACAKWNFSTLHHLFLAVNANSNPYTLASKGRLSPERHLRTCFGCDCLWATSIRASLLTFRDFYIFLHVFSRDTQEGKLPALCQSAMEAPGQRFSLPSHHAAHGSFAWGGLSSVCTAAKG